MFEPKAYPEILARLVAHTRASTDKLSDFNVGSVTRSWLEAGAIGLDELWMGATQAVIQAIPEAVYLAFGFERLPQAYALGELTFYLDALSTEEVTIPAGTRVRALGGTTEYITVETGVIPAGEYEVTVQARAAEAGPEANVDAGTLSVIVSTTASALFATNRAPISNGRFEETDAERQARFADYIESLARGTVAALDYAARLAYLTEGGTLVEQVRHVAIIEVPGTVDLYVHNGVGGTSQALVERVRALVEGDRDEYTGTITPGWRAAGVEVRYHAMTDVPLHVTAKLALAGGHDLARVRRGIEDTLASLTRTFTGSFLAIPEIINALYGVPGVLDLTLESPVAGLSYRPWERPVYGSATLTVES